MLRLNVHLSTAEIFVFMNWFNYTYKGYRLQALTMPVFHTKVIESILEPVAQQVNSVLACVLFILIVSAIHKYVSSVKKNKANNPTFT